MVDMYGLTGQIPTQIGNLTELTNLNMQFMISLKGTIPPEIGKLTELNTLMMFNMGLTGQIPIQIGNLTELTDLRMVNMTGIIGQIPTQIGRLTELNSLIIADMDSLSGTIPTEIGRLTALNNPYNFYGQSGMFISNTCLQVDEGGIKAIESLPTYEKGEVNLNQNCILKAQLPLANISQTNCNSCPSCKGIPACT